MHRFFQTVPFLVLALLLAACGNSTPTPDPTGETVNITVEKGYEEFAGFVAYQDGNSDWREVDPVDGVYSFAVENEAGRYSVAFLCHKETWAGTRIKPIVVHATTEEMNSFTFPCIGYPSIGDETTMTGSIVNIDPAYNTVRVANSSQEELVDRQDGESAIGFELPAYDGLHDVIVGDDLIDGSPGHIAIKRDVPVAGPTSVTIDFSDSLSTDAFDVVIHGANPNDSIFVESTLLTENLRWPGFQLSIEQYGFAPQIDARFRAASVTELQDGDLQFLVVEAEDDAGQYRYYERSIEGDSALEVELPSGDLEFTAQPTPGQPWHRHQLTWQDVGANLHHIKLKHETPDLLAEWEVTITPGWQTTRSYTLPDFNSLDAWDSDWNVDQASDPFSDGEFRAYFGDQAHALHQLHYWTTPNKGESAYIRAFFPGNDSMIN